MVDFCSLKEYIINFNECLLENSIIFIEAKKIVILLYIGRLSFWMGTHIISIFSHCFQWILTFNFTLSYYFFGTVIDFIKMHSFSSGDSRRQIFKLKSSVTCNPRKQNKASFLYFLFEKKSILISFYFSAFLYIIKFEKTPYFFSFHLLGFFTLIYLYWLAYIYMSIY